MNRSDEEYKKLMEVYEKSYDNLSKKVEDLSEELADRIIKGSKTWQE